MPPPRAMLGKMKRALSRKKDGASPQKWRVDCSVLWIEGVPGVISQCRVVWARHKKMQYTGATQAFDGRATWNQPMSQMVTLYALKVSPAGAPRLGRSARAVPVLPPRRRGPRAPSAGEVASPAARGGGIRGIHGSLPVHLVFRLPLRSSLPVIVASPRRARPR